MKWFHSEVFFFLRIPPPLPMAHCQLPVYRSMLHQPSRAKRQAWSPSGTHWKPPESSACQHAKWEPKYWPVLHVWGEPLVLECVQGACGDSLLFGGIQVWKKRLGKHRFNTWHCGIPHFFSFTQTPYLWFCVFRVDKLCLFSTCDFNDPAPFRHTSTDLDVEYNFYEVLSSGCWVLYPDVNIP